MMRVVGADGPRKNLYPATQADVKMMKWCLDPDGTIITDKYYVGAGLCAVDMPISIVFDTILLPIDGVQKHNYLKEKERRSMVRDTNENTNSNQGMDPTR